MAGTTNFYGISYPTSTDYVKDGATAMQTIATGFDSVVAIPTYNNQTGTSYTFVLADTGKVVTANNASAVTFTIPPQSSVAWTADTTLTVRNLGAGVVTIAGGSGVTVTNTAQTVAQYGSVRIIRTASNAWTVVPASGGASSFTYITGTTFTSQSSVSFNNCFSSTYNAYRIIGTFNTPSADGYTRFRLRASGSDNTSSYYGMKCSINASGTVAAYGDNNSSFVVVTGLDAGNTITSYHTFTDIINPFVNNRTTFSMNNVGHDPDGTILAVMGGNFHNVSQSFDGFTIYASAGTFSGTIRVYGYADS